MYQNIVLSK